MVKKRERFRRMVKKVVNLRDKMVTQKAKIKVLKSKRKENTPATGITAGSNTLVARKKKSLEYPKRLNNSKDPFYKFWQRVIYSGLTKVKCAFFFRPRIFKIFTSSKTPPPSSKNDCEPKKKQKNLPGRIFAPEKSPHHNKIRNGRDRQNRRPCRGSFYRGCAWCRKTLQTPR